MKLTDKEHSVLCRLSMSPIEGDDCWGHVTKYGMDSAYHPALDRLVARGLAEELQIFVITEEGSKSLAEISDEG